MRAAQDLVSVVELARQDCNVSTLRMALLLVLGRIDGVEHRNPGRTSEALAVSGTE